jgi:hypothetical protein
VVGVTLCVERWGLGEVTLNHFMLFLCSSGDFFEMKVGRTLGCGMR